MQPKRFNHRQKHASGFPPCPFVSFVVKIFFLLLLGTLLTATSAAQGHNWHVADFKDTISISADGSALVSEKITVMFVGTWHGIHRTIPIEYPGPNGTNYTLFLKVQSVTDESGNRSEEHTSELQS